MQNQKATSQSASLSSGVRGRFASFVLASAVVAGATSVRAGSVSYDFSTDPVAAGILDIGGNGANTAPWVASGGNPGGFLALTYPINSLFSSIVFDDIDDGKIVSAFTFNADLRVGNSQGDRAADGFSISFARTSDPILADAAAKSNMGTWAGGIAEGGSTTGIAVDFDTWSGNTLPDSGDIEGIIVRVDNVTVLKYAMPTRHGAATDITSLQTGPRDAAYWANSGDPLDAASWAGLSWVPLVVDVDATAKLTVKFKGATILDKFQTAYFPSSGRIVLAGRTGGANEHTHFDNIKLVTTAAAADLVKPTTPGAIANVSAGARRVAFTWGAATDDSGRVAYNVYRDGTKVASTLSVTNYTDLGVSPGKSYTYDVEATDISGNLSGKVSTSVKTATEVADVGFLLAEIYDGIGTTATQSLYDDAKYTGNTPDRGRYINGLTFGEPNFGDTYGENLGVVIKGVLTAPESGDFDFFVRSDDNSDFFLSANATIPKPGIDTPIASEDGCCKSFQETGGTAIQTTATPIKLVAGQKYGFAFVVKEGGGGDWGQVAMRKVGDKTSAANLKPIQGALLSGVADSVGAVVTITKNPSDVSVPANSPALFYVQATTASPYTTTVLYQWYKNGNPIAGANASSYRIDVTSAADSGAKYKVLVAVPGLSATSTEGSLTVTADNVLPTVQLVSGSAALKSATVRFSEAVTAPSSTTVANYSFSGGLTVSAATQVDARTVSLTTSAQTAGASYTLTVNGVTDAAGNAAKSSTGTLLSWSAIGTSGGATPDSVGGYSGLLTGAAVLTADALGHTGKAGDKAIDTTKTGGPVVAKEAAFLAVANAAAANDELTVSFWQKKADVADSSAFTLDSPTAGNGRNFHAHVPWSNQNVYFDTVGCCDGATQRITADIATFPDYSGTADWWTTQWHHFVFTKKGADKNIFIDGKLFLNGQSTNPLLTDSQAFYMGSGSGGGEVSHGLIDDFAVFNKALTEADSLSITKGTSPSALSAAKGLIAFWDYNAVLFPQLSPNVLSAKDTIVGSSANTPGAEGVANVIDGKSSTKYLNFDKLNTGFTVTPAAGSSIINAISITSANDSPERDPASYLIEGSEDGVFFQTIASGNVAAFSARFTTQAFTFANTAVYKTYRVTFPTVAKASTANSMQVADVGLHGATFGGGSTVTPTIAVSLDGKITFTGALLGADNAAGPFTAVAGATSPFSPNTAAAAQKFYRAGN